MANIKAGTTGKADATLFTPNCVLCHAAGTFGFGIDSLPAPGWSASFDDETITVPPEATPGSYMIGVRSNVSQPGSCPGGNSAPCKHLDFTVVAADSPPNGPGPGCPGC